MLNMENAEEVLQILERYTRLKQKEIPKELDEYLCYIAKTGDTVYKWSSLKYLFREKLLSVIKDFHDSTQNIDDLPQYPNVDPFNYEGLKSVLLERLDLFSAAPFTIQRLCDLLTNPRKQYSRIDKYMRALEKTILVVSTIDPGRKTTESENGDSLDSLANGDLSLDVNVDIEMEAEPQTEPVLCKIDNDTSLKTTSKVLNNSKSDDDILPNPKKPKLDIKEDDEKIPENINNEIEHTEENESKSISNESVTQSEVKAPSKENSDDIKNEVDMKVVPTDEKPEEEIQNGKKESSVGKADEDIKLENNNKDEENTKPAAISNGAIKNISDSSDKVNDVSDKIDATINENRNDVINDKCDASKTENAEIVKPMEKSETVEKENSINTTTDSEAKIPKEVTTDVNEDSDSSNKENIPVKEEETSVSASAENTDEPKEGSPTREKNSTDESIVKEEKQNEKLPTVVEVTNADEKVVEAVSEVNEPIKKVEVINETKPSEEISKDEPSSTNATPIKQTDISKPSLTSSITPVEIEAKPIDTPPIEVVEPIKNQPMDETSSPPVISSCSSVEEGTNVGVTAIAPDINDVDMKNDDVESIKDDKADTAKMDVDDRHPDNAIVQ